MKKILCIDIGGSKMLTGVVDETGRVLFSRKLLLNHPTKQQVADAILTESEAVMKSDAWKDNGTDDIDGIGVSIPGLTDPEEGIWVYAPFSHIENLNVRMLLTEKYHKPVYMENDGNICTLGEKRFGVAKNDSDFIWVTVSNGIGSGVFLNNCVLRGFSQGAGELGHVKVVDYGVKCHCGSRGCLEMYGAAPGIVRRYRELSGRAHEMTAQEVSQLAQNGDKNAQRVFEDEGFYLGKGIAAAVNILNVPLVVIGGGVSASFDLFETSLRSTLKDFLFLDANKNLRIEKTGLGYEASLISAGACALYGMEKEGYK
ncbi:MAG: ROK family protein [Oscillospiraceae bacterium]